MYIKHVYNGKTGAQVWEVFGEKALKDNHSVYKNFNEMCLFF